MERRLRDVHYATEMREHSCSSPITLNVLCDKKCQANWCSRLFLKLVLHIVERWGERETAKKAPLHRVPNV